MASESQLEDVDSRRFEKAEDYVLNRLERTDHPLSPAELADQYGRTGVHMRQVLADLAQENQLKRVARGQYELPDDDLDEEQDTETNESEPSESSLQPTEENERQNSTDDSSIDESTENNLSDHSEEVVGLVGGLDPRTVMMFLSVAVVVYLVVQALKEDTPAGQPSDEQPGPEQEAEAQQGLIN